MIKIAGKGVLDILTLSFAFLTAQTLDFLAIFFEDFCWMFNALKCFNNSFFAWDWIGI